MHFLNVLKHTHIAQTLLYERFTVYIAVLWSPHGSSRSAWCLGLVFWTLRLREHILEPAATSTTLSSPNANL